MKATSINEEENICASAEAPEMDAFLDGLPPELREQLRLEDIEFTQEQFDRQMNSVYNQIGKRAIDALLAVFGLAVTWWLMAIIALAVLADSGKPVLYRPQRGGYRGNPFRICKFRTMVQNADKIGGGTTALNDSRITRVGAILRKTKLDEFPQLFNILAGDMSFVGPRPELLQYTDAYEGLEKNILNVRPGITDYSSLTFINLDEVVGGENADEMYERYVLARKNQLRMKYAATVSLKTDAGLFCKTVGRVFGEVVRTVGGKMSEVPAEKVLAAAAGVIVFGLGLAARKR